MEFLGLESCLGGQKIEGFVVKNYDKLNPEGKVMMGKVVSEAFKETHSAEWKKQHPSQGDIVSDIVRDLGSEARWVKAVQARKDSGELLDAVQDIGPLIGLVQKDVHDEQGEEIGRLLFKYFWKDIRRGLSDGLPMWYKARLAGLLAGEAKVEPDEPVDEGEYEVGMVFSL